MPRLAAPSVVPVLAFAVATLLGLSLVAWPAAAQPPGGAPAGVQWSLGVGVVLSPEPYVGSENVDIQPIPVVSVESKRFYLRGIVAGLRLVERERWGLDWIVAKARFMGYDADDSAFLTGMDDRELSVDGGVAARVALGGGVELQLEALTDLLGRHEGHELAATVQRPVRHGRAWRLTPSLGVRWQSDDLVRYYYGVEPDEARPERPAYRPDATTVFEAGVGAMYLSRGRWVWQGQLSVDVLGSTIDGSPLVDRSTSLGGHTFVAWRL